MTNAALLLLFLLTSCAASGSAPEHEPAPAPALPADANRMQPDHAPTPFSAAEIQAACTEGSYREFATTTRDGVQSFRMVFGASDDRGVAVETVLLDDAGGELSRAAGPPVAWTDLQAHASYPAEATTISSSRTQVLAGEFDTWTYFMRGTGGDEVAAVFARDLPGPPILMTTWKNGLEVSRMELVAFGPRPDGE